MPSATASATTTAAAADHDEPLPFLGLKVIDCASFIAAPVAATLLADMGADVIKLEPPGGDPHRGLVHVLGCTPNPAPPADAGDNNFVWDLNARHKRSLVLDLKQPAGQAALHRLVAQSDVFITNLPLPVRARLAIDAPTLLALNPRLVFASLTAYGETGPEAAKTGFDVTAYWARAGLMDMVRTDANAPPTRPVAGMGDHPSAVTLFGAIAAALYRRERTGRGGLVSTSLLANGLWSNAIQVQAQLAGAHFAPRQPRSHAPSPLSNIYRCRDGRWLSLVVLNEARQLPPLLQALGLGHLQGDARLATPATREQHNAELIALFDAGFARHDLASWRMQLDALGITFGVVGTLAEVHGDEQMRAAGAIIPYGHRSGMTVAGPMHLHGSRPRPPGPAPALGAHSRELLAEAGFSHDEIAALRAARVVQMHADNFQEL